MRNKIAHSFEILLLAILGGVMAAPSLATETRNAQAHARRTVERARPPIVDNANSCAPDLAKAVWGPDSQLVGYRC